MKTIEEMEKEEQEILSGFWEIGQEAREILFNLTKKSTVAFVVLVAIVFVLCSDSVIAAACIIASVVLSSHMVVLGYIYMRQKIDLWLLQAILKQARQTELAHNMAIQLGKTAIEAIKNGVL